MTQPITKTKYALLAAIFVAMALIVRNNWPFNAIVRNNWPFNAIDSRTTTIESVVDSTPNLSANAAQALQLNIKDSIPSGKPVSSGTLLQSIYESEQSVRELVIETADLYMSSKPRPEAYLGWRPTLLNVESVVAGSFSYGSDASSRVPVDILEIEAFPTTKFIAKKTRYLDFGWSGSWQGDLIEGGTGTVTVNLVTDNEEGTTALVQIATEKQRIAIVYAGKNDTYVVIDLNELYHQKLD